MSIILKGLERIAEEQLEQQVLQAQLDSNEITESDADQVRLTAMKMICDRDTHPAPTGWSEEVWNKVFNKTILDRLVLAGTMIVNEIDRLRLIQIGEELKYVHPESNGFGIEIPQQYQWAFPVNCNGYIVELKDKNGVKYCEASGLTWTDFIDEFNKPINATFRLSLLPIWTYASLQVTNGNLIAV